MAIYMAAGPTYENGYYHGSRFQSKWLYTRLPGLRMKMALYMAADSNAGHLKMALYTAAFSQRKWLYTRLPGLYLKMAVCTAAVLRQEWLYTRMPGPRMKLAIYTAAVFNAKMAIYTANGPTYRNSYIHDSYLEVKNGYNTTAV